MDDYKELELTRWRIEGIIERGSVYDKAKLFLRDRVGYFRMIGGKFILKYGEPEILMDSVRPKDRKEWNRYLSYGLRLENGFKDLTRFATRINENRTSLRNILELKMEFEEIQNLLNSILTIRSIGEKPEGESIIEWRRDIASMGLSGTNLTLTRPSVRQEGIISLNLEETHSDSDIERGKISLTDRAIRGRDNLRISVRTFVCFSEALKRRIKESEIIIPEYQMMIENLSKMADENIHSNWRFEGVQDRRLGRIGHFDPKPTTIPLPSMERFIEIEDYSVRPKDIDLNEEEELISRYYKSI